jgi:REP element-mobilizing transposase RayT
MDKLPVRKYNRLPGYDYSSNGAYFVTICVNNKKKLLGKIEDLSCPCVVLSEIGKAVDKEISILSGTYAGITVDKYVIMPNHIHMLLSVAREDDEFSRDKNTDIPPTLSRMIKQFKGSVTKKIGVSVYSAESGVEYKKSQRSASNEESVINPAGRSADLGAYGLRDTVRRSGPRGRRRRRDGRRFNAHPVSPALEPGRREHEVPA